MAEITNPVRWKSTDIEQIFKSNGRRLHDTGPGNPDGFAPYNFSGRKKYDGHWRSQPYYAKAASKPVPTWPWDT